MNIVWARSGWLLVGAALLLTAACSREQADDLSDATEKATAEATSTISTEAWVDEVRLNSTSGDAAQGGFSAGQTLQLSMSAPE